MACLLSIIFGNLAGGVPNMNMKMEMITKKKKKRKMCELEMLKCKNCECCLDFTKIEDEVFVMKLQKCLC